MPTFPHVHAIVGSRYYETELATLATYTLPEALHCKHCELAFALVTDEVNSTSELVAMQTFGPQIASLQRAIDNDHSLGHPSWRFLTDAVHLVGPKPSLWAI